MLRKRMLGLLASGLFFMAGAAGAATVNFDGPTILPVSALNFTASDGQTTVTARAMTHNSGVPQSAALVGRYYGGLGVCSGGRSYYGTGCFGDDHQVDGGYSASDPDEIVLFDFGSDVVRLTSVTFSLVGSNDDFEFAFYGSGGGAPTSYFSNIALPDGASVVTYYFSQSWIGSVFGIGANGYDDEFKIKALSFGDVAPVPLPAAGWLFLVSMGGMIALRRRGRSEA